MSKPLGDLIPAFCRISPERRKAAWVGVPLTLQGNDGTPVDAANRYRPKTWSPEAEALEQALLKQDKAKTAERIATMKLKQGAKQ